MSYEMSEAARANPTAPVRSKRRHHWVHQSAANLRVNQSSLQLSAWPHRQTARERSCPQGTQLPRWLFAQPSIK